MAPIKGSPDNLPPLVYQQIDETIKDTILKYFNYCSKYQIYPKSWKIANVQIHEKPNRQDKQHFKSYRPISLLPIIAKWFSKVMYNRIQTFCQQNNIINKHQFGFTRNVGCEDALLKMSNIIEKNIVNNKYCLLISLDISGAFDNTWHISIIYNLIRKRFPYHIIRLIANFLNDRTVILNLHNTTVEKKLTKSCPQGEILSPFLWNVDFDDFFNENIDGHTQAFADDSYLLLIDDDIKVLEHKGNEALSNLIKWGKRKSYHLTHKKLKQYCLPEK